MLDRLEALFAHFSVTAEVFNTGALCGINDVDPGEAGCLHLVRRGTVDVHHGGTLAVRVETPSLLLYPQPMPHRFVTDPVCGADLACAYLRFRGGASNPIAAAMPPFVCLPLDAVQGGGEVLALLFDEASNSYCGRRAMLDRLFEVVFIQVLRRLMTEGETRVGMLAGLAHPRLRIALSAMHAQPAFDWSLEALAAQAGMSRSAFANAFRDVVGATPGAYLQRWRIGIVQQALREGRALKRIADEVGYGSEAALSRAFKAQTGLSPRRWRDAQASAESG